VATALPVWRSLLFVPVTAKRFVHGAARRGADAIILDFEDSVAASEKDRARTMVPEVAEIVSRGGADVVVASTGHCVWQCATSRRLIAMVETAAAFFHLAEIARAHPRLCALYLGAEDFANSAGVSPDAEALSMPNQMAVFAARAAGIGHWASSVRSPSSTTSTAFARRFAAPADSALSAPR
jgi:citrate lyase subunit beta / citryl-CoA lyase